MLRINLLPAYVAQRRLNKKLTVVYTAVFAAVVSGMLGYEFLVLRPEDSRETSLANAAVAAKSYLDSEAALAASTTATAAPIQANINFYNAVEAYNSAYPKLYDTIARFTSPKILYTSMAVSGTTLTINAYTPSIEELGRYLQVMYHEPDLNSISVSAIPTPDQAAEKIYMYKGKVIGVAGGTVAAAAGNASTVIPGVPAGVSVTLPPGVVLPTPAAGQVGPAGTLPSLVPTAGNGGQNGAANATAYAYIENDPDFDPRLFKVVVRRTDGFSFVATCSLKAPLSPPAPGAAAAPASLSRPN